MNKFPASLRSDFSDCRFARNKCHFASESMPISSEYTVSSPPLDYCAPMLSSAGLNSFVRNAG
jgi:hypothetical protein